MLRVVFGLCFIASIVAGGVHAATVDDLKLEVENLRKQISKRADTSPISRAEVNFDNKYGPNAQVTTNNGKLSINGLVQVWYQSVQNDHQGITRSAHGTTNFAIPDNNEVLDNDTFRVRRTELRFTMDIHENITASILMDPAREGNISFLPLPTFPAHNIGFINPLFIQTGASPGSNGLGRQVALTTGGSENFPSLLQDAYINFHGMIPHHDITIGQFKPPSGEEANRNSGQLEFVERAMVTTINNVRDIGVMVHGDWFDHRVQYWVGAFNGPQGTVLGNPDLLEGGNRSDDNDDKDIAWRVAFHPVWDPAPEHWRGRFELGYARTDGYRGKNGSQFEFAPTTTDTSKVTNGMNEERTAINRQAAWVWYRPGGEIRGWWLRGEWGSGHDRFSTSGSFGAISTGFLGLGSGGDRFGIVTQLNPTPVDVSGWYFGTGYKMSETRFAEGLKNKGNFGKFINQLEFAFRYEAYQNIATEDPANPDRHTLLFKTSAYTAGVNWYINGFNSRIQANYIFVDDPENRNIGLRESKNNVFVVNFQVMF